MGETHILLDSDERPWAFIVRPAHASPSETFEIAIRNLTDFTEYRALVSLREAAEIIEELASAISEALI